MQENNKMEMSDYALSLTKEYDYKGPYLYVDNEGEGLLRTRLACAGFCTLICAAFVIGGLSGFHGSSQLYIMIPFVAIFIPMAMLLSSLIYAIPFAKKMTPLQFKRGFVRMRTSSWFILVLGIVSVLAELVYIMVVCPASQRSAEMVFVGCGALGVVLTTVFISFQKRIPIKSTEEKPEENANAAG